MIRENELRIGNVIFYNENEFTKCTIGEFVHILRFPEKYKPIPLTEEILLKCGFVSDGYSFITNVKNEFILNIEFHDELVVYYKLTYGENYTVIAYIEHLHQLQNLYFALTGEELTINL